MSKSTMRGGRGAVAITVAAAAVALMAAPAAACGGLVGENGTIKLTRTVTLAAYHAGVERYVTSFEFSGTGKSVGSIVPLPGVPSKVERGGSWTLQRLEREVAPLVPGAQGRFAASPTSLDKAVVLLQTKIDALDITVLRGGGSAVGTWAVDHGYLLTPDAPEMLDFYARRSPIFMAARFDASRARRLGQSSGDGTPIMLTIPTKDPWVPLRILGLGLGRTAVVDADVFLLTDHRPKLLAGGRGLSLVRDEQANAPLLSDLRTDKGMAWVPDQMWLTFLRLHVLAGQLRYDLAVSTRPDEVPALAATGVSASAALPVVVHTGRPVWPLGVAVTAGMVTFAVAGWFGRRRRPLVGASA
jgi:Uncharacterized protein conserved in bacteria (DUF2330)